jgi:flagellar basal body rod protein FlgG
MMDALSIAASGLNLASAQVNVAANNIANFNTPGYGTEELDPISAPDGDGVEIGGVQQTNQPVNLPNQVIDLKQVALMYDANAMVVRTADQMYGSLLNVLDNQNTNQDQGWDNS